MPVETTDKYVRVRVKNPDLFQADSLRTIDMAKDGSIRAVIGRLKGETVTTVQSYLFDKDKFTEAEAVAWVEQHKKVHPPITMQREYKVFPILSKEVGESFPTHVGVNLQCKQAARARGLSFPTHVGVNRYFFIEKAEYDVVSPHTWG